MAGAAMAAARGAAGASAAAVRRPAARRARGGRAPARPTAGAPRARRVAARAAEVSPDYVPADGPPNAAWRCAAILPYVLPLIEGLVFGREIYDQYEVSNLLLTVFGPVLNAYHANSVIPFLVFFALFLVVVRNNKLPHFVRFNAMQSILLDICLMLAGLVISYLPMELQVSMVGGFMCTMTFVTSIGAVAYCAYHTLVGTYADIPVVSEAVYIQVRP